MIIQSWQYCQNCQFYALVKNSNKRLIFFFPDITSRSIFPVFQQTYCTKFQNSKWLMWTCHQIVTRYNLSIADWTKCKKIFLKDKIQKSVGYPNKDIYNSQNCWHNGPKSSYILSSCTDLWTKYLMCFSLHNPLTNWKFVLRCMIPCRVTVSHKDPIYQDNIVIHNSNYSCPGNLVFLHNAFPCEHLSCVPRAMKLIMSHGLGLAFLFLTYLHLCLPNSRHD